MGGNDTLTLMNTYGTSDGQYMISGLQNTYIVCDVFSYYYRSGYGDDAFDVLIFDNANRLRWQNGYDLDEEDSTIAPNYIRIKYNEIENITTSDSYTITSSQLAELAELTASWMSNNGMRTYFDDMRGDNSYSVDMNNCLAYVQEQAADMWTHV